MFVSQIASAIAFQADRILISSFGSPAIAGAYALCANVANKPLAAVVAITSFAYPHAAALHVGGANDQLAALLQALDRAVAVLVIPLLLPALWLAQPFLKLWLGVYGTAELALAFKVLLVAFAIPAFAVPVGHVLAASGNPTGRPFFLADRRTHGGRNHRTGSGIRSAWRCRRRFVAMSTSLIFSIVARRALGLGKSAAQSRFWAGIALGVATQALVLLPLTSFVDDWWTSSFGGGTDGWLSFLVRVIFRMLSPEEIRLLGRLRKVIPFSSHKH